MPVSVPVQRLSWDRGLAGLTSYHCCGVVNGGFMMNAGEVKAERIAKFKELLALVEENKESVCINCR